MASSPHVCMGEYPSLVHYIRSYDFPNCSGQVCHMLEPEIRNWALGVAHLSENKAKHALGARANAMLRAGGSLVMNPGCVSGIIRRTVAQMGVVPKTLQAHFLPPDDTKSDSLTDIANDDIKSIELQEDKNIGGGAVQASTSALTGKEAEKAVQTPETASTGGVKDNTCATGGGGESIKEAATCITKLKRRKKKRKRFV